MRSSSASTVLRHTAHREARVSLVEYYGRSRSSCLARSTARARGARSSSSSRSSSCRSSRCASSRRSSEALRGRGAIPPPDRISPPARAAPPRPSRQALRARRREARQAVKLSFQLEPKDAGRAAHRRRRATRTTGPTATQGRPRARRPRRQHHGRLPSRVADRLRRGRGRRACLQGPCQARGLLLVHLHDAAHPATRRAPPRRASSAGGSRKPAAVAEQIADRAKAYTEPISETLPEILRAACSAAGSAGKRIDIEEVMLRFASRRGDEYLLEEQTCCCRTAMAAAHHTCPACYWARLRLLGTGDPDPRATAALGAACRSAPTSCIRLAPSPARGAALLLRHQMLTQYRDQTRISRPSPRTPSSASRPCRLADGRTVDASIGTGPALAQAAPAAATHPLLHLRRRAVMLPSATRGARRAIGSPTPTEPHHRLEVYSGFERSEEHLDLVAHRAMLYAYAIGHPLRVLSPRGAWDLCILVDRAPLTNQFVVRMPPSGHLHWTTLLPWNHATLPLHARVPLFAVRSYDERGWRAPIDRGLDLRAIGPIDGITERVLLTERADAQGEQAAQSLGLDCHTSSAPPPLALHEPTTRTHPPAEKPKPTPHRPPPAAGGGEARRGRGRGRRRGRRRRGRRRRGRRRRGGGEGGDGGGGGGDGGGGGGRSAATTADELDVNAACTSSMGRRSSSWRTFGC